MYRNVSFLVLFLFIFSLGGCPGQPGDTDPNDTPPMGDGGNGGDGNGGDGGDGDDGGNGGDDGGDGGDGGDNGDGGGGDGDGTGDGDGDFFLRSLSVDERDEILELAGQFGNTAGEVFVNGSVRPLARKGWTPTLVEVRINKQDLGQVYVQVGDRVTNPRFITGWDFTIKRSSVLRLRSVCPDCTAEMTWKFRVRGDVQPIDFGEGQTSTGSMANQGVKGAEFTLDSVTGTYELSGATRVLSLEPSNPVYYQDTNASFSLGGGEWFSAFAGVDVADGQAIVIVHVDTDGYRDTILDTGESFVHHITEFGVYTNLSHPGTIVMPMSPSLNIPAGSTPPDSVGATWEWEAAPVQSPPPPGS